MKKLLFLLACILVLGAAESGAYEPIVKEGKQWVYYQKSMVTINKVTYSLPMRMYFEGDTMLSAEKYKKLHMEYTQKANDNATIETRHFVAGYAREDANGNVMVYYKGNMIYPYVGAYTGYDIIVYPNLEKGIEAVQYMFDCMGLTVGQRARYGTITGEDTEIIGGKKRHVYKTSTDRIKLIEGIGMIQTNDETGYRRLANFMYLRDEVSNPFLFSHYIEDGEIVYKGELYDYYSQFDYEKLQNAKNVGVDDIDIDTGAAGDDGSGLYYDMQGRAVKQPTEVGIYIRDGKKIVVK